MTTKKCPNCGNEQLLLLMTYNMKICTDCDMKIDWYLDKGQKPLLQKGVLNEFVDTIRENANRACAQVANCSDL